MYRAKVFASALTLVTLCLFPAAPASAQPTGYEGYQVVHIEATTQAELDLVYGLRGLGHDFEVWSEVIKPGRIEARVSPVAQPALAASGLRYQVYIKDLQLYLNEQFRGLRDPAFFNSLRTYSEHEQFMADLAAAYPDLAEMVNIGYSVEGREMWALRITNAGDTRPGVLYHGAEHGNEAATASVVAYVADHLLTNYDSDPDVAYLVDHVEWFLLPIMNPDGYVDYERFNAHGVDLNRNWDGPGSGQDFYGGPYPFSEPETAAMRDFLLANPHVRMHVDLHGYVPWIMWPWAHIPNHCPDHADYYDMGVEIRSLVAAAGGGYYDIGTIYDVAYPVSGCSCNYTYGVLGLWTFAIEVVDADMPEICEEFLASLLYLGEWIWGEDCNGNGVSDADDIAGGTSQDSNGNGVPDECEMAPSPGDLNCDGTINGFDIDPFIMVIGGDLTGYYTQYPDCDHLLADVNDDGEVNGFDIDPFVSLVGGG